MLMGADNGRIDHHPPKTLELRIISEELEECLQAARGDPASKAVVDGVPGAELGRQIPPGDAGASQVEQSLKEQAIRYLRLGTFVMSFRLVD